MDPIDLDMLAIDILCSTPTAPGDHGMKYDHLKDGIGYFRALPLLSHPGGGECSAVPKYATSRRGWYNHPNTSQCSKICSLD